MNNFLSNKEKKKIFFFFKKYINDDFDYIYNKLKQIILFAKNNLYFLYYNQIFFFFKNLNLIHLKNVIFIIKKFNINIYENIPEKKIYLNNLNFKKNNFKKIEKIKKLNWDFFKINYFKKDNNLRENKNIVKCYILIEKFLLKIKNKFIKNYFFLKLLILKIKLKKKIYNKIIRKNNLKKFSKLEKKFFYFICNNKISFSKKKEKKKIFNFFFFFLEKLILNKKLNKLKSYRNFFKKFKFIKYDLNFNLPLLDEVYNLLYFYYKKIVNIKNILFDILLNISNISLIKFTFFFNKNGSNIDWILNIINFSNLDKTFLKKFKKFIFLQKKKIKKIEKRISIPISKFIEIFSFIELNKFKIDIIKNNIIEDNLYLVSYAANKYCKKELYWDYVQEGNLGLIYSVNKFNYKYKNFKNFTIFNIKSNINKFFYKSSRLINLPLTLMSSLKKINKIINSYFNKFNKKPSVKYIEKKTKLSQIEILKALKHNKDPIFLGNDNNYEYEDKDFSNLIKDDVQITQEDYILNVQLKEIINKIINDFEKNHKDIICMVYGINDFKKCSYQEIARKYSMTKKEIYKINDYFLEKINNIDLINKLKKFF